MTHLKTKFALLTTAAALCCTLTAVAQDDPAKSMGADKTFVMTADESNSAEIAQSQIALLKSKNPDVKAYAKQMIDDHEKLRSDMGPFAKSLGVMTPQKLNPTHKVAVQRLSELHGAKFDAEYIKNMDVDHHITLGLFNNEIATTSNPDLKNTVQQGQVVIKGHTDMADQMASKMNVPVPTIPGS